MDQDFASHQMVLVSELPHKREEMQVYLQQQEQLYTMLKQKWYKFTLMKLGEMLVR